MLGDNHTYDLGNSQFEQTCPGYFYRLDEEGNWGNASGCGNETASLMERLYHLLHLDNTALGVTRIGAV